MTILLDTNVVISAVTDRYETQRRRAEQLFRSAADGSLELALPQFVLFETCFVLGNLYGVSEATVAEIFGELVRMPGTTVIHEIPIENWFEFWPDRIRDVADAALASIAVANKWEVATFDRHFARCLRNLGVAVWKS